MQEIPIDGGRRLYGEYLSSYPADAQQGWNVFKRSSFPWQAAFIIHPPFSEANAHSIFARHRFVTAWSEQSKAL